MKWIIGWVLLNIPVGVGLGLLVPHQPGSVALCALYYIYSGLVLAVLCRPQGRDR